MKLLAASVVIFVLAAALGSVHSQTVNHCEPQCTWNCSTPNCPAKCHPLCLKPRCVINCAKLEAADCKPHCEAPECTVRCAKDANKCPLDNCPDCKTVCAPPKCHTVCVAPQAVCTPQCEPENCTWSCQKPVTCERPRCNLVCPIMPSCSGIGCCTHSIGVNGQVLQENSTHDYCNQQGGVWVTHTCYPTTSTPSSTAASAASTSTAGAFIALPPAAAFESRGPVMAPVLATPSSIPQQYQYQPVMDNVLAPVAAPVSLLEQSVKTNTKCCSAPCKHSALMAAIASANRNSPIHEDMMPSFLEVYDTVQHQSLNGECVCCL